MPLSGGTPAVTATVSGTVSSERVTTTVTLTIAQSAAVSDVVDMRKYAAGIIIMPAGWDAADLGAQICDTTDGTFAKLKDVSNGYGTDVSIDGPAASLAYICPGWWFGAHYLKLYSHDGSGTDTVQTAARTLKLLLKS